MILSTVLSDWFEKPRSRARFLISGSVFSSLFVYYLHPFGLLDDYSQAGIGVSAALLGHFIPFAIAVGIGEFIVRPVCMCKFRNEISNLISFISELLFLAITTMGWYLLNAGFENLKETNPAEFAIDAIIMLLLAYGICVFPSLIIALYKKQEDSIDATHHSELLFFSDDDNGQPFAVKESSILYIKGAENYIEIAYLEGDKLKSRLIRMTMENVEKHVLPRLLVRCHRSYFVNVSRISTVEKKTGRVFLVLDEQKYRLPLSRSYSSHVLYLLKRRNQDAGLS